jgi:hypothetical protein
MSHHNRIVLKQRKSRRPKRDPLPIPPMPGNRPLATRFPQVDPNHYDPDFNFFQPTSARPVSPCPKLHVPDPAHIRHCLKEYNIGQMQNVLDRNNEAIMPISHSHLRVIRQVIDRTMDDPELNNHLREQAIILLTQRFERCILEQRETCDYPPYPQDQRAMNLLETLSAERELMMGRIPEPSAAEHRRAVLNRRRKALQRSFESELDEADAAIVSEANNPSSSGSASSEAVCMSGSESASSEAVCMSGSGSADSEAVRMSGSGSAIASAGADRAAVCGERAASFSSSDARSAAERIRMDAAAAEASPLKLLSGPGSSPPASLIAAS